MIPFVDLNAQYIEMKAEIDKAVNDCITEGIFVRGKIVGEFEDHFRKYIGSEHCIGCGNGTDALEIILLSLGIGHGDEVIVPALSWIASAECVSNVGAEPVFVDINPDNFTIDINKITEKITPRTKAIIPVHLYGGPADMDTIMQIAGKYKLFVVEDCAQAHGAEYNGRKVGTFGIASAFSFFPSKNLGAFGDAGAILTDNQKLAETARMISNHGQLNKRHSHEMIGRNSRLDSIQASVLNVKLNHLDDWNKKRNVAASYYRSGLEKAGKIILPSVEKWKKHVYHLFVIRCDDREKLIELFDKNNISYGIHYPKALPFLDAYRYKQHNENEFPVASEITEKIISLPIYPEISEQQLGTVVELILTAF